MKLKGFFLAAAAVIFLVFGVLMLVTAYYQDHPFVFLALFYSSNFIILLSAAILVGLIWRACYPVKNHVGGENYPPVDE
ncbi:MAG: hypothetical protein HQK55_00040 [Deltaproteobacteria bacterium]|nr:hypothetical protein [Deltaproteobacteria bacterium]